MNRERDHEIRTGLHPILGTLSKLYQCANVIFIEFFVKLRVLTSADFQITRERLNRDVAFLAGQITMLEQAAMREEEKIEDLKLKCEMFR